MSLPLLAPSVHTWNYRRYLVQTIRALSPEALAARTEPIPPTSAESELAFTRKKIEENFSNYSAWHYRTKLLERLWIEKGWKEGDVERAKMAGEGECSGAGGGVGPVPSEFLGLTDSRLLLAEFEFVRTALWTNPDDQSSWLYHRWLIGEGEYSRTLPDTHHSGSR